MWHVTLKWKKILDTFTLLIIEPLCFNKPAHFPEFHLDKKFDLFKERFADIWIRNKLNKTGHISASCLWTSLHFPNHRSSLLVCCRFACLPIVGEDVFQQAQVWCTGSFTRGACPHCTRCGPPAYLWLCNELLWK